MASKRRTKGDIDDEVISVDEAEPWVRVLAYGPNGSGKTRFAATAPDVVICDINERGTRSARHTGAHVFPANSWEDVVHFYWYLKRNPRGFKSFALDTITAMQGVAMRHTLREAAARDPNRDPKLPTKRDYGKVSELMRTQLLAFRNLPMHCVFTAQERVVGDPEEGEPIMHQPNLSAANLDTAMGAVEIIGRTFRHQVTTKKKGAKKATSKWDDFMLVGDHESFRTKDRTNNLGRLIRNPTVPLIIAASFNGDEEE